MDDRARRECSTLASWLLLAGLAARVGLIRAVRTALPPARANVLLTPHETLSLGPLALAAALVLAGIAAPDSFAGKFLPARDGHSTIVFGAQWLGWLLVLHKRAELEAGFVAHAFGATGVIVLILPGKSWLLAIIVLSCVAVAARCGATRPGVVWAGLAVVAAAEYWVADGADQPRDERRTRELACSWVFAIVEVLTAFAMKFQIPGVFPQPLAGYNGPPASGNKEKTSRNPLMSDSEGSMHGLSPFAHSPPPGPALVAPASLPVANSGSLFLTSASSPPPPFSANGQGYIGDPRSHVYTAPNVHNIPKHRRMGSDGSTGWIVGSGVGLDAGNSGGSLNSIKELDGEGEEEDEDDEDDEDDVDVEGLVAVATTRGVPHHR